MWACGGLFPKNCPPCGPIAPIIANVFGRTVEEYAEVVRHLEGAEGVAAYELNISCPNVACGGIQFGSNPRMAAEWWRRPKSAAGHFG